jgi:large subunit ribosomal protein L33
MRARVAWAHDWVSDPTLAALFQTLPGASFVINRATPAKNSALTSAGAAYRLSPAAERSEAHTGPRSGFRLRGNPYIRARDATRSRLTMAKATTIKVKLVSSADTGFYYVTRKNSRTMTDKLVKKKYDPVAKKHVEFRESKIK